MFYQFEGRMICLLFYIYHNELICKCTQEESNCMAILEKCENKLARKSYEDDLKERKE